MTFHTTRSVRARGSLKSGHPGKNHRVSPKIAICFPPALLERLSDEAQDRQVPFARVVRERLEASYREGDK